MLFKLKFCSYKFSSVWQLSECSNSVTPSGFAPPPPTAWIENKILKVVTSLELMIYFLNFFNQFYLLGCADMILLPSLMFGGIIVDLHIEDLTMISSDSES